MARVVLLGGTGYIGRPLAAALVARDHEVRAIVRDAGRLQVPGVAGIVADVLTPDSWRATVGPGDTIVQLVGTPHPSPAKAAEFARVDLVAGLAAVGVAREQGAGHVVYLSVAHPAPVMRAYIAVRQQVETALAASGVPHTILRPWYVLGPGHRWPHLLRPLYAVAARVPSMHDTARRLGLVTLGQMVHALVEAVEERPDVARIVEVPAIRAARARGHMRRTSAGPPTSG